MQLNLIRYIFDNSKIETVYNYEGDKAESLNLKMCKDKVFFRQSVGNERLKVNYMNGILQDKEQIK